MGSIVSSIVFQPPNEENSIAFIHLLRCNKAMKYVSLRDGSKVSYMRFKPTRTTAPFVILYSHGNAEHLGTCAGNLQYLANVLGVTIIGYDYRGYGYSGPITEPSEQSVFEDADVMYAHLTGTEPDDLKFPENRVIIMGRSVGGGPATYLAEQHHEHIAGLILQSTFTSCLHVPKVACLATCCCCIDMFDNASRIKHVTGCPILLMHGDCDQVVPFHCSEKLFQIASKARNKMAAKPVPAPQPLFAGGATPQELSDARETSPAEVSYATFQTPPPPTVSKVRFHPFSGCDHNDIECHLPEEYYQTLRSFLSELLL